MSTATRLACAASEEAWRRRLREAGWRVVGEPARRLRLRHAPGSDANLVPSGPAREDCAGAACEDDEEPDGIPDP